MGFKKVEKKVINIWIIRRTILLVISLVGYIISLNVIGNELKTLFLLILVFGGFILLLEIYYAFILPFLQYNRYQYLIKEDEIDVMSGFIFKHTFVLPIIQVQDISSNQTPLEIIYKQATVSISTAGSVRDIEGLSKETAEKLVMDIKEKVKMLVTDKLSKGDK